MKNKNNLPKMYKKTYLFLLLAATIFMGIGYAAVNSVTLNIEGLATADASTGVFIKSVSSGNNQGAVLENCKVNSSPKTTLSTTIELGDDNNAYYTFNVTIKNNSNDKYVYTGTTTDVAFYTDENDAYNASIIYEPSGITNGYILEENAEITFQVTFRYSENTAQKILNSFINFVFKKIHYVTYSSPNENYPSYVLDGETLVVDMSDQDYDVLTVKMDGVTITEYTHENKVLTLPNVTGDVEISTSKDTPTSGIPAQKDFETTITPQGNLYFMLSLTNTTDRDATGWAVYIEVPSDTEIVTYYNCSIEHDKVNNILIITNASWNGSIAAGETGYYLAGITISTSNTDYMPTNYTAIIKND